MTTATNINLKDYYIWYKNDEITEVSEAVAEELLADIRYEKAHSQRIRRNLAFYSLDEMDGIETSVINHNTYNPEEMVMEMHEYCRLCQALNSLSETQGRRVEAHFLLGKSQKEIAEAEGVTQSAVNHSIVNGLSNMRKFMTNFDNRVYFCPQSEADI